MSNCSAVACRPRACCVVLMWGSHQRLTAKTIAFDRCSTSHDAIPGPQQGMQLFDHCIIHARTPHCIHAKSAMPHCFHRCTLMSNVSCSNMRYAVRTVNAVDGTEIGTLLLTSRTFQPMRLINMSSASWGGSIGCTGAGATTSCMSGSLCSAPLSWRLCSAKTKKTLSC